LIAVLADTNVLTQLRQELRGTFDHGGLMVGEVSRGVPNRWFPVEPGRVRRAFQNHPWVFAYYFQTPDERDDRNWYHAIVFRDEDRTQFGAFELIAEDVTVPDFERRYDKRQIAARIITDTEFRNSLLRDSSELLKLWRRR
jgi:hypothetical protein